MSARSPRAPRKAGAPAKPAILSMPSVPHGRKQLVSTPLVVFAAMLAAAILLALFPSERVLREIAERRKSDVLSIAYLRLLLRTHPDDGAVEIALAQAYMQAGEWNKARLILVPMAAHDTEEGRAAAMALTEIAWQRYIGMAPGDPNRTVAARELGKELGLLAKRPVTLASARRLAELAAALDRPAISAALYERLAVLDPPQESVWLLLAADAHVAAGTPAQAAPILARLGRQAAIPAGTRAAYVTRALAQWLAAGQGKPALEYVALLMGSDSTAGEFGNDAGLLQQGITIARAHSDGARAQSWGRRLLALTPDDIARLSQQLDIELSVQALPQALVLSRRLVQLAPDSARRIQLAQIASWSGQQALALQQWVTVARQDPAGQAMQQALVLANARAEDALWLQLAGLAMKSRALTAAELGAVTALEQRNANPHGLAGFLLAYLERHGGDTVADENTMAQRQILWRTLARQQQVIGDSEAALLTWQRIQAGGGQGFTAIEIALAQARLLATLGRPAQATLVLDAVAQQAGNGIAYWILAGDLAWQLGRDGVALSSYQRAWDAGNMVPSFAPSATEPAPAPAWAQVAERLIAGYNRKREAAAAVRTGRQAYVRLDDARWLLLAMDAAAAAGQWNELRELLAQATQQPLLFEDKDMYWLLLARSASQDNRLPEARAAYEKVLSRSPGLVHARLALLWMDIDHGKGSQLRSDLARWENDAAGDSAYWAAYAFGLESLQEYERALPWFELLARKHEKEALWALHHAEVVKKAGHEEQARRMRHAVYSRLRTRLGSAGGMLKAVYRPGATMQAAMSTAASPEPTSAFLPASSLVSSPARSLDPVSDPARASIPAALPAFPAGPGTPGASRATSAPSAPAPLSARTDGAIQDKALMLAYARLSQEFSGSAAGDRVLLALVEQGGDDSEVFEMLVASALAEHDTKLAGERLSAAHRRRHRLPVWQSMAVAMATTDKQAIAAVLADSERNAWLAGGAAVAGNADGRGQPDGQQATGGSTGAASAAGSEARSDALARLPGTGVLTPTDKVEAMRVLGLHADALRYADSTLQEETYAGNALLRKQRDSLAAQQATKVKGGVGERRIGPLQMTQQEAQASVALDPVRATVRVGQTRFSSRGGEYGLAGINTERDFSLAVEGQADAVTPLFRLTLGTLQRHDNSPLYGRFEWARRLTPRAALSVDTSFNMASEETAALRLFGMKDKLSSGLTLDLSDRVYTRFDVAGQRYRSRGGETLGRGYRVAAEAGATVLPDAPFWQVRVSGSWEKNHLANSVPADLLGSRLQGTAVIGDLVAERFGLLALGSSLRFGDPESRPNRSYAQADVFAGHEWPAKRNAYGARVLFSMPVSAPDELRLEAYYSNAQRGTAAQASRGIGITYMRAF